MKVLALLLAALVVAPAAAQRPATEQELARVFAYAREFREKLPSLECDELILSQRVKKGKVKWEVRIEATLQELRDESGPDEFKDRRIFNSVDGKPPKKRFKLPYFVHSAFSNGLGMTGEPKPACLDYRIRSLDDNTIELKVDSRPGVSDPSCADEPEEFHKTLWIDSASGAVKHVERDLSQRWANRHRDVPHALIDFAPQKLGGQMLWLPVRVEASDPEKEGRVIATYSNFHRFVGEGKILPDNAVVETSQ